MKTQQLRPKYPLERYIVAFEFPGIPDENVQVTTELVSGIDPNVNNFSRWLFNTGNIVCVLAFAGVPGCIYKIVCTTRVSNTAYTREGIVAVKHSAAVLPPDAPNLEDPILVPTGLPMSLNASSRQYPYLMQEATSIWFVPTTGELNLLTEVGSLFDEILSALISLSGSLTEVVSVGNLAADPVDITFIPLSGDLDVRVKVGTLSSDKIDIAYLPLTGSLAPNPSGVIQPNNLTASFIPLGGSLS